MCSSTAPSRADVVPPPTLTELDEALRAEVEHLERHVEAGDTDPYEATYAFLNGSRIVRGIETGDVVISKREAGPWASSTCRTDGARRSSGTPRLRQGRERRR
jgi:hypothetical protein